MAAQTVHNRPIGGGYLSTIPPEALQAIRNEPALRDLADVPKLERPIDRRALLKLGFHWVVLHKYRTESYRAERLAEIKPSDLLERKAALRLGGIPDEIMERIRKQLSELCGEPRFEDEQIVVFDLRNKGTPTQDSSP